MKKRKWEVNYYFIGVGYSCKISGGKMDDKRD